jgi:hypothetical protein
MGGGPRGGSTFIARRWIGFRNQHRFGGGGIGRRNARYARFCYERRNGEGGADLEAPLVIGLEHTDSTRRGANEQGSDWRGGPTGQQRGARDR